MVKFFIGGLAALIGVGVLMPGATQPSTLVFEAETISTVPVKPTNNDHVEYGEVNWQRNYDKAVSLSKASGKPLFVLFQEVPG